jgi:DNA repair photolyase
LTKEDPIVPDIESSALYAELAEQGGCSTGRDAGRDALVQVGKRSRSVSVENGFYGSPRWSWELLDCAMPMTLDTYSNCAFQCTYCFSYFQRAINHGSEAYLLHKVKPVDVRKIIKMFTDPDKHAGQFAWYIKERKVVQWGGLSDGFDFYERELGVSLELLRFFREIKYPISISTKGVWYLRDKRYRELLEDSPEVQMKLSVVTTDPEVARKVEGGVATPRERFDALREMREMGVGCVTTRFRPYIIGISDKTVDELFEWSAEARVHSLTTEFMCLESRALGHGDKRWKHLSRLCGFDVVKFYKQNSVKKTGLMRLNYDLKRPYIAKMRLLAAHHRIPFYVSDAHHKECSAGTGCCGLPDTGPLSNIARGQFAEAIQIAKKKGLTKFSDIAHDASMFSAVPYKNASGFNSGGSRERADRFHQSLADYIRSSWNDVNSNNSPARYFGGALVPYGTDENGDVVYYYNIPFIERGERPETAAEVVEEVRRRFGANSPGE